MRKQQKTVLWPSYVDSSRTRKEGRKVSKSVGVLNPTLAELQGAAEKLKMKPEAEADATHPSSPWRKTGRILVQKKGTKTQTLMRIAKEIAAMRQQTKK
ncbi:MAG: signal recognition particle subunit SRP19/SEC65 family protein [Candidatus Bathyarchaeia archaeon]